MTTILHAIVWCLIKLNWVFKVVSIRMKYLTRRAFHEYIRSTSMPEEEKATRIAKFNAIDDTDDGNKFNSTKPQ